MYLGSNNFQRVKGLIWKKILQLSQTHDTLPLEEKMHLLSQMLAVAVIVTFLTGEERGRGSMWLGRRRLRHRSPRVLTGL